ncbi:LytTR family DNA-binding domain-containing protein [Cohnella faecalis]|uniref:LytTR family transcriptional regulator n=1 Tax=Cohnella faecalis TaxID=2315694 RepID=A0A398CDK6_9BACL|nr:LytTR family DNA-binding domain-containing protein [Cohnella faecalis]RIE01266.1 LytTR family transcriptional regulator [Cohnella faecalis]
MLWNGAFNLMEDTEGLTGFKSVHADDILFFCVQQNQIVAHTLEKQYFTGWDSLDRLWRAVKASDPRYYRTDRVYIVNLSKVVLLDQEWCKLYFGDDSTSKHCYVARSRLLEVKQRMKLISDGMPYS